MFTIRWTPISTEQYTKLREKAECACDSRKKKNVRKSTKDEGIFKQVAKTLQHLRVNPRHPSLNTHEYESLPHPWDSNQKVFEAYAQNNTPGAYRVFWCYGPEKGEITIIAITPHP